MAKDPYDMIAPEIEHLYKKRTSSWDTRPWLMLFRLLAFFCFFGLVGLYFFDPFMFGFEKSRAAYAYSYIKEYGEPAVLEKLDASGLFNGREVAFLHQKKVYGLKGRFSSPEEAEKMAQGALDYMKDRLCLETGDLTQASALARFRYNLFNRNGIKPPLRWKWLDARAVY